MPRGGLGMVVYMAENKSGIPLDIFIKSDKRDFTYYKERIAWKERKGSMDYVMLPEEWKSYYMEVFSQGIGPRESVNRIESMVFQFIPKQWLGMKLVPLMEEPVRVTVNNEAKATGWAGETGEVVRVNGWEQGWLTKEGGYYYWPNILAWVGYGISLVVLIGFSFWPKKKPHGKI